MLHKSKRVIWIALLVGVGLLRAAEKSCTHRFFDPYTVETSESDPDIACEELYENGQVSACDGVCSYVNITGAFCASPNSPVNCYGCATDDEVPVDYEKVTSSPPCMRAVNQDAEENSPYRYYCDCPPYDANIEVPGVHAGVLHYEIIDCDLCNPNSGS